MIRGKKGQPDDEIVRAFATRAFRRPVSEEQIVPYLRLARTSPEGLRSAIEAILCSPRFLYLQENGEDLDDYAIASRLSYFLWNTMPDKALLKDAAERKLRNSETLAKHLSACCPTPARTTSSTPSSGHGCTSTTPSRWPLIQLNFTSFTATASTRQ